MDHLKLINDADRLLAEAADEITQLRKVNREQEVRLKMFDDVMLLVRAQVPGYGASCGTSLDIKGKILQLRATIEATMNAEHERLTKPTSSL